MRIIPLTLSAIVTVALIYVMDIQLAVRGAKTPRLGLFLSPQKGFWQNAEPVETTFSGNFSFSQLQGKTEVYLDDRLVPHIYAEDENDAYFVQGYLHARFRLWQMEFQTHAAAGRLSEIMGDSASGTNFLKVDRFFRRLGMVYGAEQALIAIENDPVTKAACDAYTAGANTYIKTLTPDQYPLEYKLLNYAPELWTNLKTALFLKYMSFDLAGYEQDFEMTNAKSFFTKEQFEKLYPYGQDSLDPIHPKGTLFEAAGVQLKIPANADSVYFNYKTTYNPANSAIQPDPGNGSNSWAVHGNKTASGKPILCNDPHLGFNLPSIWYEMQISTPSFNAYGVSFPGAPSVIIGFNDSIAFGFTNAERDVKDYYEITFRDTSMQEYWYDSAWQKASFRNEVIKIRGKPDLVEKIPMTVWGPVMYNKDYADALQTNKAYAVHWKAHEPSNELRTFNRLNHAKNYTDFVDAIASFKCPGQNMTFASKAGDIAIRQQGDFPAKWRRQGDFVMPGDNNSYQWVENIPYNANPVMVNPSRGFVSSANQLPYDTTYPYYLGGFYPPYRGFIINRNLSNMQNITIEDMQRMQTDNYNVFAEMAKPVLLKYMDETKLNGEEKRMFYLFKTWNLRNDNNEKGPSVFTAWWDSLMTHVYTDELSQSKNPLPFPEQSTLLESLIKDSAYEFADNIETSHQESISDIVLQAFKSAIPVLLKAEKEKTLGWSKFKDSGVRHLLKIPALSRLHLPVGGGNHNINTTKQYHGPSWRMVVHLTNNTEAYGVYPGGQSGNPGSKYYDSFIDMWAAGKYYKLQLTTLEQAKQMPVKGKLIFSKS